jgi:hypothetical protein
MLQPEFPKLSQRLRKVFLTLHVGFAVSWLGVSIAMLVLSVTGLVAEDLDLRHHAYNFMHIFDPAIVIPLVLLSIITGLVVSMGTHWGLVKTWWVLAKFVGALGILGFASLKENFWVRELAEKTAANRGADLGGVDLKLAVCIGVFCAALWTATILSIYKPWDRTPWGERSWRKTVRLSRLLGQPPHHPHKSNEAGVQAVRMSKRQHLSKPSMGSMGAVRYRRTVQQFPKEAYL